MQCYKFSVKITNIECNLLLILTEDIIYGLDGLNTDRLATAL